MNYENMTLEELEREAYRTDNKLALAIYSHVAAAAEEAAESAYERGFAAGVDELYDSEDSRP